MLSLAPSSVGMKSAIFKQTPFINIPINIFKEGWFFVSGWFHLSCGCFGLLLVLFFYPKYFPWKLVPGCDDSNMKKKNPVTYTFCSSASFTSLCTSRMYYQQESYFFPDSPTLYKARFYKPLCTVGSAII